MANRAMAYYSVNIAKFMSDNELDQRYARFAWARRTARQIALDGGHGTMVTIYERDAGGSIVPGSQMVNYFNVSGSVRVAKVNAR